MIRPRKRYIGGVCESLGLKLKIPPLVIRIIFVITTIIFMFPILLYSILWLVIPNYQEIINKNKRNKFQLIGLIIGAFLGALIGFYGPILFFGMLSGIILLICGIIGIPAGGLIGFMIGRGIVERN